MQKSQRLCLLVAASIVVGVVLTRDRKQPPNSSPRFVASIRAGRAGAATNSEPLILRTGGERLVSVLETDSLPDPGVHPIALTSASAAATGKSVPAAPDFNFDLPSAEMPPASQSPPPVTQSEKSIQLKEVTLTGNNSVPEWVLRLLLKSRIKTPGISAGRFRPSSADEDQLELKRYYIELGYFDVDVKHHVTLSDDTTEARVEFIINEGTRYRVRNIEFLGNISFSDTQLREHMQLQPGDVYDGRVEASDKKNLLARYRKIGLEYVHVAPRTRSLEDQDPGYVDLVIEIREHRETAGREDGENLRDISRLAISGVRSFDLASLRHALSIEFDLITVATPDIPLEQYLEKLQAAIESGYRHGGFRDAIVETNYRQERHQIEARVREGIRLQCGAVQVTGASAVPADVLVRALTEDPKPVNFHWRKGRPAPFDEEATAEIRKVLEIAFEEAGYFRPDFEVTIDPESEGVTAILNVTVYDEGPRAVVGRVLVAESPRHSAVDVLELLDLETGQPFDRQMPWRLERRLMDSGRFLSVDVKTGNVSEDPPEKRQLHDLKISLREYGDAPPLSAPLSPAEGALLKLRDWLDHWKLGETEEEIVVSGEAPPAALKAIWNWFGSRQPAGRDAQAQAAFEPGLAFRMIVAPRRGQTVSLGAVTPNGTQLMEVVFAAYSDHLVLASLGRKANLVLPNSADDRLYLSLEGNAARADDRDGRFRINLGGGWSTRSIPDPSPFEVRLDFAAAFILSLAHYENTHTEVRDGVHHIRNDDFELQIDDATGRLVELRTQPAAGSSFFTIRAEKHALKHELARLETPLAECTASYDSDSPWKSRLDFAVDELLFVAEQAQVQDGIASLGALHKLAHLWSPPAIARLFEPWTKSFPEKEDAFRLPHGGRLTIGSLLDPGSPSRKVCIAGGVLPVYREFVPQTGALWPVGRDLVIQWATDQATPGDRLWRPELAVEMSPASQLVMQLLDKHVNGSLSALASRESLQCLELATIATGCEPFLAGDSWAGQWLLSVAAAIKELNESELQQICCLITTDDAVRQALVQSLSLVRKSPDVPLTEIVPLVFSRFWELVLHMESSAPR